MLITLGAIGKLLKSVSAEELGVLLGITDANVLASITAERDRALVFDDALDRDDGGDLDEISFALGMLSSQLRAHCRASAVG